jgi:hypothetical protein
MLIDKSRDLDRCLGPGGLTRIDDHMRFAFPLAEIQRQQRPTPEHTMEQNRRAVTVDHVLPRPFAIAAARQRRERITRRDRPILRGAIRRTPPAARKPCRECRVERPRSTPVCPPDTILVSAIRN